MAVKYVQFPAAAQMLGVTVEELSEMRSRGDVYGYRDGSTWKFKQQELERVAEELGRSLAEPVAEGESGINLDLDDLLDSDGDSSGQLSLDEGSPTMVGPADDIDLSSDIDLGSDVDIGGSGIDIGGSGIDLGSDLDLSSDSLLGSDVRLVSETPDIQVGGASDIQVGKDESPESEPAETSDWTLGSDIRLADESSITDESSAGSALDSDDDDLVLGSGVGSDVTLGEASDSGISIDQLADSGLSLDEAPLDLGSATGVSGLGSGLGSDVGSLIEDSGIGGAETQLQSEDFMLTPDKDFGEEAPSASDSSSQVVTLDENDFADAAASSVGDAGSPLVEESVSGGTAAAPAAFAAAGRVPLEASYSAFNIMALGMIAAVLALTGTFMFDVIRQMWSWNEPYNLTSPLMEQIIAMLGG